MGALNAHAAGTRTVTLDARTVAAHVGGSFLVIGTMPIGVVFLKPITHWLCIIVHEGLHRRAANSRPLGLSLDACFVVTDSTGRKLAYLSRMITVNYFMQFLGAKSAGEIDQCRLVNQS